MSSDNGTRIPISSSPAIGNVASLTNFVGMGVLAFFLNGSATQQLAGLQETREAVARIEVRVSGVDALRDKVAELREEIDELERSATPITALNAIESQISDLDGRIEDIEDCMHDRKRCR